MPTQKIMSHTIVTYAIGLFLIIKIELSEA